MAGAATLGVKAAPPPDDGAPVVPDADAPGDRDKLAADDAGTGTV